MPNSKTNILVVDDEVQILTALRRMLHGQPYRVVTAGSATEGLRLIEDEVFAVLISDYRMPDMNGVKFLQEAKHRQPDSVRMILTGYADIGLVIDAVNKGEIFRFIAKPWNDDELILTIAQSLEHWRLLQDNRKLTLDLQARNAELNRLNDNLEIEIARRSRELLLKDRSYLLTQFIIENLPVAVLGVDESDMIALANRKAQELCAHPGDMLIGSRYQEAFHEVVSDAINRCRASDGIRTVELPVQDKRYRMHHIPITLAMMPRNGLLVFAEI